MRSLSSCGSAYFALALGTALTASPALGATYYDAHQVDRIAAQSLNVLRAHEQQLDALKAAPFILSASYYWMPASFRDGTGDFYDGAWLSRLKLGGALQVGDLDGAHAAAGGAVDMALAGIRNRGPKDSAPYTFQSLIWASVGYGKLSVTGGLRVDRTWIGLNGFGQFAGSASPAPRPGATPEAQAAFEVADPRTLFSGLVYARYTSFSAGAVFGQSLPATEPSARPKTTLQAVRLLAMPPASIRNDLLGGLVPGVGLNRIDGAADYYSEHYDELLASMAQGVPVPSRPAIYEIPVVLADIRGLGLGATATTQVSPEVLFRMAEVYFEAPWKSWPIGVRAQLYRRGAKYVPGLAAHAGVAFGSSGYGVRIVYDRNSPNPENFYAIPDATVLGLELYKDSVAPAKEDE